MTLWVIHHCVFYVVNHGLYLIEFGTYAEKLIILMLILPMALVENVSPRNNNAWKEYFFVITTDCNEGNKNMFSTMKQIQSTLNYHFPHRTLAKVLKVLSVIGCRNYLLKGNVFHFSTSLATNQQKKWQLWQNDHAKNKDRQ